MLSEFAGAARELRQAYMVNPYDLDGMKETIMLALNDEKSTKERRMRLLKRQVRQNPISRWAGRFLGDLDRLGSGKE